MPDFFTYQFAKTKAATGSSNKIMQKIRKQEKLLTEAATVHQQMYHESKKLDSFIHNSLLI